MEKVEQHIQNEVVRNSYVNELNEITLCLWEGKCHFY